MNLTTLEKYTTLDETALYDINGGIVSITIFGVVYTGWKAVTIIGAMAAGSAGIFIGGVWVGFNGVINR